MAISTKRLHELWRAETDSGKKRLLHALMLESLAPRERQVLDVVSRCEAATSQDVVDAIGIAINHACTILKKLHDFGIAERQWDEGDSCYVWTLNRLSNREVKPVMR